MKIIKIGEKEYKFKLSFRAYILFEKTTDKTFTDYKSITDLLILMYCVIAANNDDYPASFDEFINELDDNQEAFHEFCNYLTESSEQESQFIKKKKAKK